MSDDLLMNSFLVPFGTALGGSVGITVGKVFDNWFYLTFGASGDLKRKKKEIKNRVKRRTE